MELFQYSTNKERMTVRFGIFMSMCAGAIQPTYCIIVGSIVEMFNPELSDEERHNLMLDFIWVCVTISIACYVTSYLGYTLM